MSSKRHLLKKGGITTGCGNKNPALWTFLPHLVTCGGCRKSLLMAQVELEMRAPARRSRTRNRNAKDS